MSVSMLLYAAFELRDEVENTVARLRYISEAHQTVKDDIALTKRATEKTTTDVSRAEREKLKQASYITWFLSHFLSVTWGYRTCM